MTEDQGRNRRRDDSLVFARGPFGCSMKKEISIGNILTILMLVVGAVGFLMRFEGRLSTVETKVELILAHVRMIGNSHPH